MSSTGLPGKSPVVLHISCLLPLTDSFLATVILTVIVNRGVIRETLSRLLRVLRPLSS
jgi:hypothetical protein